MATIALLLGALSLSGSVLIFLGEISSPAEWGVLTLGLATLGLGFATRGSATGKTATVLALLALLPGLALIGWLRWTVTA